ncbi:hypothetical protein [Photobacterium rosenbergii]|uniref:DUF4010 domain-containing protein n=1 Tax=Photobacterium rosenbergii TaxID=294936 RepID=A0ABU3ZK02_9GAMM|nr:hypothetical protein [Photobacterium rosenbergii]MDV5170432.1 hypothetical protein [Photobacterium rosenbergii]
MENLSYLVAFNHLFFSMVAVVIMVLLARTVVAGTKYSAVLMIVVFGLLMGTLFVESGLAQPGLGDFPVIVLLGQTTVIALIASFFVGGQEIRRLLMKQLGSVESLVEPGKHEVFVGTTSTQLVYVIRAFVLLMSIEMVSALISGRSGSHPLGESYMALAYVGMTISLILIDSKAKIANKRNYLVRGVVEVLAIIAVLIISLRISQLVSGFIGLPQIFFAMVLSSGLGMAMPKWKLGPTMNALLFAGIPVVLTGSFLVGGSHMMEAFSIPGLQSVIVYGFAGQMFWMFGGLAILIFLANANHVRNLAPGMAGGLSHSGLTGACTAGDLGATAAGRAPIMINVPFLGHIFVFTILAASAESGVLLVQWVLPLVLIGLGCVYLATKNLRKANGNDEMEIKGLMQFSFGWQITAVFGSFTILHFAGMPIENASMAAASGLSHFGLFAATQGGMFGAEAASMITFIFATPFLVHPLVFGLFGKAAENNGPMASKAVMAVFIIGSLGVLFSAFSV